MKAKLDPALELDRIEVALDDAKAAARARVPLDIEPLAQDIARLCDALVSMPSGGGREHLSRLGDLVAALDDLRAELERGSRDGSRRA